MNLEEKFNILVNKMNFGHYDEVIFETNYLIKKFPKQEALYNLLALTYQAKGEYDKSIELLNDALKRSENNIDSAKFAKFVNEKKYQPNGIDANITKNNAGNILLALLW